MRWRRSNVAPDSGTEPEAQAGFPCTASEMRALLAERAWLRDSYSSQHDERTESWIADAAKWLGPQADDRESLARLVGLIFHYEPSEVLAAPEAHAVLLRKGAREVVRALASEALACETIDSDRFKEIVNALKKKSGHSGRVLFHPIRLALAGQVGEGELDRVIVLIDRAAAAPGLAPVKTIRSRILEFCAALD
jgi:glutamyl/glutaminyl-tRNA synthetase